MSGEYNESYFKDVKEKKKTLLENRGKLTQPEKETLNKQITSQLDLERSGRICQANVGEMYSSRRNVRCFLDFLYKKV